jgi:membrane protein implicated in regulation of membrane protease activity
VSPAVKYTVARIALFVAALLALWPVELNIFVKLLLALAFSAAISLLLLRRWRDEMGQQMAEAVERRRGEKQRLRSALAGEDESRPDDHPEDSAR